MTNIEKYNAIFTYWVDLCKVKPETLDKTLWRIDTANRVYDALLSYTQLCLRAGKEVRM